MKIIKPIIALMLVTVTAAALLLSSCGQGGDGAEALTVIYEGFEKETSQFTPKEGGDPIEFRTYVWILENTSDQEISKAEVAVIALDENGEELKTDDGTSPRFSKIPLPDLEPGDRAWVKTLEVDWETAPTSYTLEFSGGKTGSFTGEPMTITDSYTIRKDWAHADYGLTIRNDGQNDFTWLIDWSDVSGDTGRQFYIVAADRDADGNIVYAENLTPLDIETMEMLVENVTIAAGEEMDVAAIGGGDIEDPEFMLCWY